MARAPAAPILPGSLHDPTGLDALERAAMADFRARLRKILAVYKNRLLLIPASPAVNVRYTYELSPGVLAAVLADVDFAVDEILLEGGEDNLWFFDAYVETAYVRGTAQTRANLAKQSVVYRNERGTLREVVRGEQYVRRIALLRAREFEEMKGLGGMVKADMGRILTDGIARGKAPLDVARNLTEQLGIEEFRANRIARTEIPGALRRARMDESDDAAEVYALDMQQMHLSALSPTTRATHRARHSKLYTTEEVRDWYSVDANGINCKCSQTEVLVDKDGKPLVPQIVARAKSMLEPE